MEARAFTVRILRIVLGAALAAALIGAAALVGFVGLWTYAGFKSPGDPTLGTLVLIAAVALFSAGGVVFGWALGARSRRLLRRIGIVFALIGVGISLWFISMN